MCYEIFLLGFRYGRVWDYELEDKFQYRVNFLVAASIKDVEQVIESIVAGADSVAVSFSIFEAMCEHPLTDKGLTGFTEDDRKIP